MSTSKPKYILPEDAVVLREATQKACQRAGAQRELDRERIADAVMWLAECGYARQSDGTLDAAVLADAAIVHFWNRRLPVVPGALGTATAAGSSIW